MRGAGMGRFSPQVIMMGGGIKRYHPDVPKHPQSGRGLDRFVAGVLADTAYNFAKGVDINGHPFTKTSFKGGYDSARKGLKRSIANRVAQEGIGQAKKKARKSFKDIFGR